MFCSISGEVPQDPVLCSKSGHIYERRLIEKHIDETGTDPVTNEEVSLQDLIAVKSNKAVAPRPVEATSIPGMISQFQKEWDSVMLETYNLRQQLDHVRQELSQALYQHDASCRVIARLVRERDEARSALANAQAALQSRGGGEQQDTDMANGGGNKVMSEGIPDDALQKMKDKAKALSKARRNRKIPEGTASKEDISSFSITRSEKIHKTAKPAVNSVDISPGNPSHILTAGDDYNAHIFDLDAGRIVSTATHSKKINEAIFHPESARQAILTASADGSCKTWTIDSDLKLHEAASFDEIDDSVVSVSVHPLGQYFCYAGAQGDWALADFDSGRTISHFKHSTDSPGYTTTRFHPDGLIMGASCSDNKVRFWDMKTQKNAATFEGHEKPVTSLSFSENGYYMTSGSEDGTVKIWDLRKLKEVHSFDVGAKVHDVKFDFSGQYIASGSDCLRFHVVKEWSQPNEIKVEGTVRSIAWGNNAHSLVCGTSKRSFDIVEQA
eukprot:gb/GECG01008145.1/.p1 GENE.gb/GECG01008145.1/~~gb/GECG01008145.1/.p1  ORF type:complete len:498 (+),score=68.19 gb/GECG01008145.1/:1-1494(+)